MHDLINTTHLGMVKGITCPSHYTENVTQRPAVQTHRLVGQAILERLIVCKVHESAPYLAIEPCMSPAHRIHAARQAKQHPQPDHHLVAVDMTAAVPVDLVQFSIDPQSVDFRPF